MQQEMQITIQDLRGKTARGKARGGEGRWGVGEHETAARMTLDGGRNPRRGPKLSPPVVLTASPDHNTRRFSGA